VNINIGYKTSKGNPKLLQDTRKEIESHTVKRQNSSVHEGDSNPIPLCAATQALTNITTSLLLTNLHVKRKYSIKLEKETEKYCNNFCSTRKPDLTGLSPSIVRRDSPTNQQRHRTLITIQGVSLPGIGFSINRPNSTIRNRGKVE